VLAAERTPNALEPQLAVMQNVNALYDVLIRITAVGDVAGGSGDAAALDSAVHQLEQARKSASAQLLQAAMQRDRELTKFRAMGNTPPPASTPSKVIVVDNRIGRHTKHTVRRKAAAPAASAGTPNSNPGPRAAAP
jgi:hypothetical protein